MKNMIIVAALALALPAGAQKGNWYIGGIGGYSSETAKTPGNNFVTSEWSFGPEAGTFLKDDIQLGLYLGLSGGSRKDDGGDLYSSSGFSPTVYGRKFFKVTENFSLFAGLYFNITSATRTDYFGGSSSEYKESGFGVRLGVGIAYALSPRFTAVGQYGLLGYQTVTGKQNGVDMSTISTFNFGVNTIGASSLSQGNGSGSLFNIGLYYTFKKNN